MESLTMSKQVKQAFEHNAIPFCDKAGVTFDVAMKLFGDAAVELAFESRTEGDIEIFMGLGKSLSEPFFTYQGFQLIAK